MPVICTVVISGVFAADPVVSEADEPPSQTAAATPPHTGEQPPVVAPRKVLVDDTVTDAQLKQILSKCYKPESQARGNEVYYCRSERELGSRFETKVCKTAAQILQDERGGKEATTYVQRTGAASREGSQ